MIHKIIQNFRKKRNAAKWKHGAKIHKPSGHRSILDNGWIPTTRLKKGNYGLIKTRKQ